MSGTTASGEFSLAEAELEPHRHLIEIGGAIDLYSSPDIKRRLLWAIDAGASELVIDLSGASHLDSTGLGVLLTASKRLTALGGRMVVVNQHPSIARVFEITGVDALFTIVPSREEALRALER